MLHLAQVQKNPISGMIELQLLAHQKSQHLWGVEERKTIALKAQKHLNEGLLVIVELENDDKIISLEEATTWVIHLIQQYLINNANDSELIAQEKERIEEWRQELTSQNLDLTRRHLEIETRRDQLQDLESSLKEETEKLQSQWKYLQEWQDELQQEREKIDIRWQQIQSTSSQESTTE
jgi:hypothetical protein